MVKFLNSDGLSRLVTLIKQALSNKQDSRLVVTYVGNNDASSTYGNILGAINAGKEVVVKYGYKDYQYCYNDSGWLYFIAVVGGYYYELRVNDEDKWNSDSFQLQSSLVSGTNIKTINNTSLLGSGNISIEPNEIASITTTESTASGGNNTVTIAETNGTTTTFNVKNGINGRDGADGTDGADGVSLGEIALVQTTGDSEESVMSQKAVTEYGHRVTEGDVVTTEALKREPRLPYGYDELDWIYNGVYDSGAVLDTLLLPDDANWRFVGSWKLIGQASSWSNVIGGVTNGNMNTYSIRLNGKILVVSAHTTLNAYTQITLDDAEYYNWHYYDLRQGTITLDGTDFTLGSTTNTPLTVTLKLGHVSFPQRIGEFKAYHNNELVADLVPCKHGSDVGMYDIIRNQFFTSSNANNFTAGECIGGGKDRLITGESLALFASKKTTIEDIQGTSDWIKTRIAEKGWSFGYRLSYASLVADETKCVSPIMDIEIVANTTLTIYHGTTSNYGSFSRLNDNGGGVQWIAETGENIMTVTVNSATSPKLRFTVGLNEIARCYIHDDTNNVYLFRGDELMYSILSEHDTYIPFDLFYNHILAQEIGYCNAKVMSQKAICEKFDTIVYESKRPSYFKGTFSKFNIADFPLFDPRDSDGISVLMEWNKKSDNHFSLFEMMTANQNNSQQFFALAYQWGNIKTGLISRYFKNVDMGCSGTTPANCNHLVITLDFKEGITKIYLNGVLYNTIQASNYSYETLMTYLNTCTKIGLGGSSSNTEIKTQGLAVFGHVLTDDDVTTLFGGGCEELKTELIPEKWEANSLKPHYFNCGIGTYNGQANSGKAGGTIVGDTITINSDCVVLYLALTGIDGSELYGNCIYDFDFEVLSGTGTTYDRGMQYAGNYWKCFTMTDEDGNDVSYNTQIGVGRYHVTSRPDNIRVGSYNGSLNLGYIFVNCSSDFSIKLYSPVRLIERGAAIICTPKTYKGPYWQQRNGYKIPTSGYVYDSSTNTIPYYDLYKSSTVKYASNVSPQFNGQMAVDTTNGKVYVGYLTGTGGTWKQINNS